MTTASVAYGPADAPAGPDDVLALFAERVRLDPSAPAVEDGELSWSYGALDELADRAADALRGRVRPGDLVGVCLDRSAALVATAVAVARLGAVYLPLGPRPGERRLAAVAAGLRVTCLVGTAGTLPEAYRAGGTTPLPLPSSGANADGEPVAVFPAAHGEPAPAGAFYAVLTSGTTGTPKAVAVSSAALAARLRWYAARTGSGPGERHSLLVGVSFDPHLMELWTALTSGAALAVAPDDVRWDPETLTGWWRRAGVTASILPTPLAELVLERPWPRGLALRHLSTGGDRLRRRPGADVTARVDNHYGPAEGTVLVTAHALAAGGEGEPAPPIGTPLPGVVVCVTDAAGAVVPRGEPGELRVGGAALALGYLDEELTARRFVAPPEGVTGTDRVYRTGDRVVMREDGVLEFLGRLDGQLKIRGVRIEPAEVEAALERDARVLRAVVAAEPAAGGGTRLTAYVRPVPGAEAPPAADLLAEARAWLPEQAVPAVVRRVDAFPLDANGKVDRAALAAAAAAPAPESSRGPAPSATEDLVLDLCRGLLSRPDLSLDDNFLASGGDSLSAARLLTALEEHRGVRLRAPQVLRRPDLRALAALVDRRAAANAPDGAPRTVTTPGLVASADPEPGPARAGSAPSGGGVSGYKGPDGGVLARVLAHAAATPSALAVTDGGTALTYAELTTAARNLAGVLRERGVVPGTPVGLLLPHSPGLVVAQLAVWWAGGHYVPLDAAYPRARTERMLADAGAALTVGGKDLLEATGIAAGRALAVSAATGAAEDAPDVPQAAAPEPHPCAPGATAYVMFTSGSTGRPKPVPVPHGAVAELVTDPEYVTLTPRDRVLFHSPLAFDASPMEEWLALANGAALAVSTGDRRSLEGLARDAERLGATVALLTTALFHHLAARGSALFSVLRGVLVGGEALSARHARAVLRAHPWLELLNVYGPTEATSVATVHRVREADCDGPPPIGRPVAGATAHVVDGRLAAVPAGTRGELLIGGGRLAPGYLGQPERTAERFVDHPEWGRVYRTGDLVSARPDGTLEFHGRLDGQVKVRGYRIEPGEIEHALRSHAGVADAVVTAVGNDDGTDARLAAFVVPAGGAGAEEAALRDHLAALLPPHMVPTAWSVVESLPVTANGKVDRAALAAAPAGGQQTPQPLGARELTPVEQAVAAAWSRALEREVVSPDADFLALGGHSLLALGIVDDLREDLGVELSLAAFFAAPTLAEQALLVERGLSGSLRAEDGRC
ncbi:amino acid adenylation domain-containing protein [Streptomyces caatingaensis]|uniref:amino acid adenylation domain-containing protein n=1 Tax=Streptomyces caatingaensis TaxID=1678637 RepID=UPI000B10366F|nr:amino acid adenylation domain-containing protein [Streptomyces caatingaensis]